MPWKSVMLENVVGLQEEHHEESPDQAPVASLSFHGLT